MSRSQELEAIKEALYEWDQDPTSEAKRDTLFNLINAVRGNFTAEEILIAIRKRHMRDFRAQKKREDIPKMPPH